MTTIDDFKIIDKSKLPVEDDFTGITYLTIDDSNRLALQAYISQYEAKSIDFITNDELTNQINRPDYNHTITKITGGWELVYSSKIPTVIHVSLDDSINNTASIQEIPKGYRVFTSSLNLGIVGI